MAKKKQGRVELLGYNKVKWTAKIDKALHKLSITGAAVSIVDGGMVALSHGRE